MSSGEEWAEPVEGQSRPWFLDGAEERWAAYQASREGARPPWASELLAWREVPGPGGGREVDLERSLDELCRHDSTAARAVVKRYGDEFLAVVGEKATLFRRWNGRVWEADLGGVGVHARVDELWWALDRALKQVLGAVELEASGAGDRARIGGGGDDEAKKAAEAVRKALAGRMKKHVEYWDRLGGHSARGAVIGQLGMIPERSRRVEDFDVVPEMTVVRNGVLDLSGFWDELDARKVGRGTPGSDGPVIELLPHDAVRTVTQLAAVDYAPEVGVGPVWAGYVESVLDEPVVRWHLQKALGVTLLGKPNDKMVLELIGQPNSGKSVLIDVLSDLLGDYAKQASPDSFTAPLKNGQPISLPRGAGSASPDLDRLKLAKLVLTSEPSPGSGFEMNLMKRITGRDKIQTRDLYVSGMHEWRPRFLLVVATNDIIKVDVSDDAGQERVHPIFFGRVFRKPGAGETWEDIPEAERADLTLTSRIVGSEAERSGVLNWLIEGLRGYMREGLIEPEAVAEFRKEIAEGASSVVAWVEEQVRTGRIVRMNRDEMKAAEARGEARGSWPQKACIGVSELCEVYNTEIVAVGGIEVSVKTFRKQTGSHGMNDPQRRVNRGPTFSGRKNESVLDKLWWSNTDERVAADAVGAVVPPPGPVGAVAAAAPGSLAAAAARWS